MKLGVIRTISRDEFKSNKDVPSWLDNFLYILNGFIEQVGTALKNNLTFADNFFCTVTSLEFTSGTELSVNPSAGRTTKVRVLGVIPLTTGSLQIDKFGWMQKSDGSIGVTITFASGTSATVKLLILFE